MTSSIWVVQLCILHCWNAQNLSYPTIINTLGFETREREPLNLLIIGALTLVKISDSKQILVTAYLGRSILAGLFCGGGGGGSGVPCGAFLCFRAAEHGFLWRFARHVAASCWLLTRSCIITTSHWMLPLNEAKVTYRVNKLKLQISICENMNFLFHVFWKFMNFPKHITLLFWYDSVKQMTWGMI